MIFLTVGSQLPFNRLVQTVDQWCANNRQEVIAQIGLTDYEPDNLIHYQTLSPDEYQRLFENADFIIGHAGMGTIITSFTLSKPLLIMPRRAEKKEHRNDHQMMTIKQFANHKHIRVAKNEKELIMEIDFMVGNYKELVNSINDSGISEELTGKLKEFAASI